MTEKLNIHQKLVEVRKSIDGFTKDTQGYGYKYVSGSQVLQKIQAKMNEHGVLLIPKITSQQFEKHEYVNKKGKPTLDFLVYGNMTYTWVNAENPDDFIEVPFYYTGAQDDISKAFGSGLTYSERYFIIKFFNLPTDADDPDARETGGHSNYQQQQHQQGYQQQNYQQAPQYQQQAPQQDPNLRSEAQSKAIYAKVKGIESTTGIDGNTVYLDAARAARVPETISTSQLTKAQAKAIIDALAQREQELGIAR